MLCYQVGAELARAKEAIAAGSGARAALERDVEAARQSLEQQSARAAQQLACRDLESQELRKRLEAALEAQTAAETQARSAARGERAAREENRLQSARFEHARRERALMVRLLHAAKQRLCDLEAAFGDLATPTRGWRGVQPPAAATEVRDTLHLLFSDQFAKLLDADPFVLADGESRPPRGVRA